MHFHLILAINIWVFGCLCEDQTSSRSKQSRALERSLSINAIFKKCPLHIFSFELYLSEKKMCHITI